MRLGTLARVRQVYITLIGRTAVSDSHHVGYSLQGRRGVEGLTTIRIVMAGTGKTKKNLKKNAFLTASGLFYTAYDPWRFD